MIKFGTGGFRAVIGEDFTKENVQKIAQSLAKIIKKQHSTNPVIIGYDRRFLSCTASVWFAEVLAGNNIKTLIYNRPVPTPTVMYGVLKTDYDFGVTITASHNPYDYNGVKISTKGGKDASVTFTNLVEKFANSNLKIKTINYKIACEKGLIQSFDNMDDYISNLKKYVSNEIKNNNIKVLYNAMHGVTVECASKIAKKFNIAKFDIINGNEDPYFEHKLPSPSESTLQEFKTEVIKGGYSIGLACDGDGDRLGVVDEKGTYHNCNIILAIIYYYLVKYRNMEGDIVKNQSTSNILDKLANKFGYTCHQVPVGFKWISSKINEVNALVGGESSGGLTMINYTPCKDSMFAISLLLDAMANIKKPLSRIVEEVKKYCNYSSNYMEYNISFNNKKAMINALNKQAPNFPEQFETELTSDGHKYIFKDGSWVHIRFSGTENLLRAFIEFPTINECNKYLKSVKQYIEKYDK